MAGPVRPRLLELPGGTLTVAILATLVVGVLLLIGWSMWSGQISILANQAVARGLITFLIALAAVAIALILTVGSLISRDDDYKDRLAVGKETLTALIGVLGTIVGFYYGAAKPGENTGQAVQITNVKVTPTSLKPGETLTLATTAFGGKPPYTYSIAFEPGGIPAVSAQASGEGVISQSVTIPDKLPPSPFRFHFTLRDAAGNDAAGDNLTGKFTVEAPKP